MAGRTSSVPKATVPTTVDPGRSRQHIAVTMAALLLMLLFLMLSWIALERLFVSEARFNLEADLDEQASYMTGRFETHLAILDVVERIVHTEYARSGTVDQDNLSQLASTLMVVPGSYGLQVEGPDGMSFTYPTDLELPSGFDSDTESSSSTLATEARTTIPDVVTLPDGRSIIIYARTASLDDGESIRVTLAVDITDALAASGLSQKMDEYVLAGFDTHGRAFFGDSTVQSANPVSSELYVAGAEWRLLGAPTKGWVLSILPDMLRWYALPLIVAVIGGTLLILAMSSRRRLEIAVAELERANATKSAFLAQMSHELRTPLNSVIGFSHVLLDEMAGSINAEQRQQLTMVERSGRHLLSLVNQLLDLSEIETGSVDVAYVEYCPQTLVFEVVESVRPQAEAKGLKFVMSVSPESICGGTRELHDGCLAFGDPGKVRDILDVLLSNAVRRTDVGRVELMMRCADGEMRFTVTDTGPEIASETAGRIFDEFAQVPVGDGRLHGAEVGLAFVRRMVLLLGGDFQVESVHEAGTTFVLSIPRNMSRPPRDFGDDSGHPMPMTNA